jgi:hypothetical protein
MIDHLFSLQTLLIALVLYGFMPGAVLRLVVLAFPKDDPRRAELRAELYAVPRIERPFWVAEQIELAIFEGLGGRLLGAASGRVIYRWRLRSGVESHAKYPETFWIPSEEEKAALSPGDHVQLAFDVKRMGGERMWVDITEVGGDRFVGVLAHDAHHIPRLRAGDVIKFTRDHVINIHPSPRDWSDSLVELAPICPCCAETRNDPVAS